MAEHSDYIMEFGKYVGRTLDEIASTPEGLRYLDYIVSQHTLRYSTKVAIEAFLADPVVSLELELALEDEDDLG